MITGTKGLVPNTIIDRVYKQGISPFNVLLKRELHPKISVSSIDGVVDSLRYLIFHENFCKPWEYEHILASLLVKAF